MITNQRLIIQTWTIWLRTWDATFSEIKEVGVKFGLVDKLLGTGTVYPITPSYPFPPGKIFGYTQAGMFRVRKLYNPATGNYEEFSEMQLWQKTNFRPCLHALKEPYEVQKLLQKAIENAQTGVAVP